MGQQRVRPWHIGGLAALGITTLLGEAHAEAVEQPMRDIWFDAIEGDFKHFQGNWHLDAHEDRTLVQHTVDLEPAFFVPRWILQLLERHIMLESLEAIIQRCLDESRHSSVSTG